MIGLFTLVAMVLWYIVEWIKKVMDGEMDARRIIILAFSVAGGVFLAFQYRLDVFVLAAEVMGIDGLQITTAGHVLAGIVLASGAAGLFELLKALRGLQPGDVISADIDTTEHMAFAQNPAERLATEQEKPPEAGKT